MGWSIHHSKDRLKSKDVYKAAGVDRSLRTAKERKDDIALNPVSLRVSAPSSPLMSIHTIVRLVGFQY